MARKLLFVVFREDECVMRHALWWAEEVAKRGHTVLVVLEGEATRALASPALAGAVEHAASLGLVAGACRAASRSMGCSKGCCEQAKDPAWVSPLHEAAARMKVPLLDGLAGHVSLGEYIDQGYEVVTF
eukprot:m51a1_g12142 hypothetical protein (129) ;mRNA; f:3102-3583